MEYSDSSILNYLYGIVEDVSNPRVNNLDDYNTGFKDKKCYYI